MADIERQTNSEQSVQAKPPSPVKPVVGQPVEAYYRGLEGVSGAMRIDSPPGTLGTLFVEDGTVRFVPGESAGTTVAFFDDPGDIRPLLRGELNPVVAGLQRRIIFEGDRALGARIVLGLHTGPIDRPTDPQRERERNVH